MGIKVVAFISWPINRTEYIQHFLIRCCVAVSLVPVGSHMRGGPFAILHKKVFSCALDRLDIRSGHPQQVTLA